MQTYNMRVEVIESGDFRAVSEQANGTLKISDEQLRSRSYTDRLFSGKSARGRFIQPQRRRWNKHKRSDQNDEDGEVQVVQSYEATIVGPQPKGTPKAIKAQRSLNQLEVAFNIPEIRMQVNSIKKKMEFNKILNHILPHSLDPQEPQGEAQARGQAVRQGHHQGGGQDPRQDREARQEEGRHQGGVREGE